MRTVPKVESDWDLLHQRRIGLDSGLAMARVFWPRLVEVNGFVYALLQTRWPAAAVQNWRNGLVRRSWPMVESPP